MVRIVTTVLTLALVSTGAASRGPRALTDSDLVVGTVAYGADSAAVRRAYGAPLKADSSVWVYSGLRVFFKNSKVHQVELSDPRYQTVRGLRVGDPVERATALYGASCVGGFFFYCRTLGGSPDVRGIGLEVVKGKIKVIRVGAVFDLD